MLNAGSAATAAERLARLLADARAARADWRLEPALALFAEAAALDPASADAEAGRAEVLFAQRQVGPALESFDRALLLGADAAPFHFLHGNLLQIAGRADDAIAAYDRALAVAPDMADARANRGRALAASGRGDAALEALRDAVARAPDAASGHANLGRLLLELGRPADALESLDRAVALAPHDLLGLLARADTMLALELWSNAVAAYERALLLDAARADAWAGRARALAGLGFPREALDSLDRAQAIDPSLPGAAALRERLQGLAAAAPPAGLERDPHHAHLAGRFLHLKMQLADWDGVGERLLPIVAAVADGVKAVPPLALLAMIDAPELHRICAGLWSREQQPPPGVAPWQPAMVPAAAADVPTRDGRIRVGYFSSDFHSHATMLLMGDMLGRHDHARFEISLFSYGPDDDQYWRRHVQAHADHFHDVAALSDAEVVALARASGLDIAVDLKGFTSGARLEILAARVAPVQMSWLGYPGSLGADFIDYVVADRQVAPDGADAWYSEKLLRLPGSYQPNAALGLLDEGLPRLATPDARRAARAAAGLPADGLLLASMNQVYKITPLMFSAWMRVLAALPDAALWLFAAAGPATANLRREMAGAGIDPARLRFAEPTAHKAHLERLPMADLFLDTFPYNAHTTASDALRMGVPVLTLAGRSFASRVAASLLHAVDMPELVTSDLEGYVAAAVALGRDPAGLQAVRAKLAARLPGSSLFDAQGVARRLEAGFAAVHARRLAGLPPAAITL